MYEVVYWLPSGEAMYWTGHSFSHNPFNASKMTLEKASYVRLDLLGKGYSSKDIEVVNA